MFDPIALDASIPQRTYQVESYLTYTIDPFSSDFCGSLDLAYSAKE